jgi:hypothetical protein
MFQERDPLQPLLRNIGKIPTRLRSISLPAQANMPRSCVRYQAQTFKSSVGNSNQKIRIVRATVRLLLDQQRAMT